MPFCLNIKHKLKQQQLQQRLQQAQLLRRRMATMTTMGTRPPVAGAPGAALPGTSQAPTPPAPGVVGGMQPPHQPGIGLKPGTQAPSPNVLQVVKQVTNL